MDKRLRIALLPALIAMALGAANAFAEGTAGATDTSPEASQIAATPTPKPRSQRHADIAPGRAHVVVRSETLWTISERLPRRGITRSQWIAATMRLNPHAFPDGNANRMRAGVRLVLPTLAEARVAGETVIPNTALAQDTRSAPAGPAGSKAQTATPPPPAVAPPVEVPASPAPPLAARSATGAAATLPAEPQQGLPQAQATAPAPGSPEGSGFPISPALLAAFGVAGVLTWGIARRWRTEPPPRPQSDMDFKGAARMPRPAEPQPPAPRAADASSAPIVPGASPATPPLAVAGGAVRELVRREGAVAPSMQTVDPQELDLKLQLAEAYRELGRDAEARDMLAEVTAVAGSQQAATAGQRLMDWYGANG